MPRKGWTLPPEPDVHVGAWQPSSLAGAQQQQPAVVTLAQPQRMYEATDALLGEVLRECLEVRRLAEQVADEVRLLRERLAMPGVVSLPTNMLRPK